MRGISFVVALQDETLSLRDFFLWFEHALVENGFLRRSQQMQTPYEVIIVSNNPQHPTVHELQKTSPLIPLKLYIDQHAVKRSDLLTKGFSLATYDTVATGNIRKFVRPDSFLRTIKKLQDSTNVIILTAKTEQAEENLQTLTDPLLYTLQKNQNPEILLFKKKVWSTIAFQPIKEKTFFIEFLHRAQEAGFGVKEYEILSLQKEYDQSQWKNFVQTVKAHVAIFLLKHKKVDPQYIAPEENTSMVNAGYGYKRKQYITHTVLQHTDSAIESFASQQIFFFLLFFLSLGFFLFYKSSLRY